MLLPKEWLLKANKQARLVEKKVCFILDVGNWWRKAAICTKARAFIDRSGGGTCRNTVQSATTVILKLVIGGLTSVILVVLGTVNLQFYD